MPTLSGGDKLASALREIGKKLKKGGTLRVGFLENSTYPDGTSVPLVAALNEFGHLVRSNEGDYYQLPRPFFRRMIAEHSGEWPAALAADLKASNNDTKLALTRAGFGIGKQLRQSIVDLEDPPLAESTIKRKGFAKPLIDTSTMLNSVEFEIDNANRTKIGEG